MISLYCPENLMFRERVEQFHSLWAKEASSAEILSLCRRIIRDFCTTESVMEVNMDERTRGKVVDAFRCGVFSGLLHSHVFAKTDCCLAGRANCRHV